MEEFRDSEKTRVALELYQNKQGILDRYQQLSDEKDIRQIRQDTLGLVEYIKSVGLFPDSPPSLDSRKESWLSRESPELGVVVAKRCDQAKDFYWIVNYRDGYIYKAHIFDEGIIIDDPADLVKEAPAIMGCFIDRLTKDIDPVAGEQ